MPKELNGVSDRVLWHWLPMRKSSRVDAGRPGSEGGVGGVEPNQMKMWSSTGPCMVHPELRNINLHNVTNPLISQNPREWMFIVQISLLIVTFLSLKLWKLSLMQTTKEVNPHPRIASCVNMWSVFFFFFCRHLLNFGACVRHIAWEGQVEWTTLA
jgi:hypothetical protein